MEGPHSLHLPGNGKGALGAFFRVGYEGMYIYTSPTGTAVFCQPAQILVMIIFAILVGIIYLRINSRELTALNVENAFYDRSVYCTCAHVAMLVDEHAERRLGSDSL